MEPSNIELTLKKPHAIGNDLSMDNHNQQPPSLSSPSPKSRKTSIIVTTEEAQDAVEKYCHDYWCKAKRTYAFDFCTFITFLLLLMLYSVQYRNGMQGYYLSQSIDDTIFAQELPFQDSHIQKTFHEVQDMGELWSYYNTVLVPALYPVTCSTKELIAGTCLPNINGNNVVISPPRLFQSRMSPVECVIPDHLSKKYNEGVLLRLKSKPCYTEFVNGETSEIFRYNTTILPPELSDCFKFKPRKLGYSVNGDLVPGYGYPVSGYECRLPEVMNTSQATAFFFILENSNWIDDATRVISLDFTVYNAAMGIFAVVRVVFEKSAFGILVPWRDIIILDIDRGNKGDYNSNFATQILLMMFVGYYLVQLGTEYHAHGKKCCCEFWNILELVNMLFFILYFLLTMLGYQYLDHEATTETIDYVDIAYPFEMAEWVLTMNMILSVMVVFKHIRVSKRLSLLLTTCRLSAKSLCSMLLVTLIFVTGFTLALYIGFGHRVYGLRNLSTTFITLLFSVFNEFEYVHEIINANRFLGPGILLIYFAFVDLILVSMLIAVVEEAFSRAQEDLRANRETDVLFNSFRNRINHLRKGMLN